MILKEKAQALDKKKNMTINIIIDRKLTGLVLRVDKLKKIPRISET